MFTYSNANICIEFKLMDQDNICFYLRHSVPKVFGLSVSAYFDHVYAIMISECLRGPFPDYVIRFLILCFSRKSVSNV